MARSNPGKLLGYIIQFPFSNDDFLTYTLYFIVILAKFLEFPEFVSFENPRPRELPQTWKDDIKYALSCCEKSYSDESETQEIGIEDGDGGTICYFDFNKDSKRLHIAFRGSLNVKDWLVDLNTNLGIDQDLAEDWGQAVKFHKGFLETSKKCVPDIKKRIDELIQVGRCPNEVILTGMGRTKTINYRLSLFFHLSFIGDK